MTENNPDHSSELSDRFLKLLQLKRLHASAKNAQGEKKIREHNGRFLFNITIEELNAFEEGDCPANTAKNNDWAV